MKKIMFNDRYGLTEAVLSGRKTQTRRIVSEKLWDRWTDYDDFCNSVAVGDIPTTREYYDEKKFFIDNSPYKVGEVVAVAQCYKDIACGALWDDLKEAYRTEPAKLAGWTNKMFVRADLMPHQIRITNVGVERLQDISDEDCEKEGLRVFKNGFACFDDKKYIAKSNIFSTPREAYAALIYSISGKGTWASNPWVLVYDFELVK